MRDPPLGGAVHEQLPRQKGWAFNQSPLAPPGPPAPRQGAEAALTCCVPAFYEEGGGGWPARGPATAHKTVWAGSQRTSVETPSFHQGLEGTGEASDLGPGLRGELSTAASSTSVNPTPAPQAPSLLPTAPLYLTSPSPTPTPHPLKVKALRHSG